MQQESVEFRQSRALVGAELCHARYQAFDFGKHVHEDLHISAVLRGAQRFSHRGSSYLLSRGTLSTLSPDECHDGISADKGAYEVRVLSMPEPLFADICRELKRPVGGFRSPLLESPALFNQFIRLHHSLCDGVSELEAETALLDFCRQLLNDAAPAPPPRALCPDIALLKAMLSDHNEPLTLTSLADASGLGRFSLLRRFREQTGLSPHQWQLRVRLERAKKSLAQETHLSIAEVAHQYGFSDASHFNRHFRQAFLMTPGDYRLSMNGQPMNRLSMNGQTLIQQTRVQQGRG
ncbi:helix-turn-helix transcriptional regulator [Shewanella sp. JM162201]|uniref:Helix-turn-helix transcriptional regulator n=1 Tax=Shewanella jiangmenensis TaxID=2837387 RepID=A0ABS5V5H0_9GAMM|nr:AraC family transcriptional regulator [Shewanella jiangmenensis]MBT1445707.1 helix-turn-helix transcriptional regulator [Shewanella jiangmenensis]